MNIFRRLLRRTRAGKAKARVKVAAAEAEKSQQRLEAVRRHIVTPLTTAGDRNHFADLLRKSLEDGWTP